MLLPGVKRSRAVQALIAVSCTRSSAKSGRPQRPRANARRCGSTARSSCLNASSLSASVPSVALMFCAVELLEQVVKAVGQGLVRDGVVEVPQALGPARFLHVPGLGRTWGPLPVIHSLWLTQRELHLAIACFLPIQ